MSFFLRRRKKKQQQQQQTTVGRKTSSLDAPFVAEKVEKKEATHTIGGGFRSSLTHQNGKRVFDDDERPNDDDSTVPVSEASSSVQSVIGLEEFTTSWTSTGSNDFHKHSPLFVTPLPGSQNALLLTAPTATNDDGEASEEEQDDLDIEIAQLGQIMVKDRQLPGTWDYSSNHILVNGERIRRNAHALTRRIELDALATERAELMAKEGKVHHGAPEDIQFRLYPCRRFGENVASGASIRSIHRDMVRNEADFNNMMDRRYIYMGMGTARSKDGTLYLCQIFKG
jgi:hypothetical protein